MVKEIQAILCFVIFGKNSKIQNGCHFWGGEIFFWKLPIIHSLDTLWVENFEIALSRTVKEIQAILCFAIFGKNSKIQNGRHFWGGEHVWKLAIVHSLIPHGSKISTKSLYLTRLRRYKQFCVFEFSAKIRKFKMAAIFGEGKFFWKLPRVHSLDTLWVENFDEIVLCHMVKEIQAILCFVIFGKNSKIQNGRHFWGGENFLKIANSTFLRYPVVRKFRRNRSISHS